MRIGLLLGLLLAAGLAGGCATVTRTPKENLNNFRAICELDALAIADDFNLMWLAQKQTQLSKWHTR